MNVRDKLEKALLEVRALAPGEWELIEASKGPALVGELVNGVAGVIPREVGHFSARIDLGCDLSVTVYAAEPVEAFVGATRELARLRGRIDRLLVGLAPDANREGCPSCELRESGLREVLLLTREPGVASVVARLAREGVEL